MNCEICGKEITRDDYLVMVPRPYQWKSIISAPAGTGLRPPTASKYLGFSTPSELDMILKYKLHYLHNKCKKENKDSYLEINGKKVYWYDYATGEFRGSNFNISSGDDFLAPVVFGGNYVDATDNDVKKQLIDDIGGWSSIRKKSIIDVFGYTAVLFFVIWGIYLNEKDSWSSDQLPRVISGAIFVIIVVSGWIYFKTRVIRPGWIKVVPFIEGKLGFQIDEDFKVKK